MQVMRVIAGVLPHPTFGRGLVRLSDAHIWVRLFDGKSLRLFDGWVTVASSPVPRKARGVRRPGREG